MHFLLRRKRVRKGGSQSTSGWALGLAVGGMLSIVLITRKVQSGITGPVDVLTILLIGFFAPRVEAVITSYHGTLMLRGKRWGAIFRATFWRASSLTMLYFAWFSPLAWVFILPPILLVQESAEKWVWDSVPKEGRRRWRRMQADKNAKNSHLRGSFNYQTPILKSRSKLPRTSRINGLVGHLTQSLNHDCSTNRVWVRARTVLRPRWMVTPSAILAGEC